jgi:hypothetical protein
MISIHQANTLIKNLPNNLTSEEWRTAACVVTGFSYGRPLKQIVEFYSLKFDDAKKWWEKFNFSEISPSEPVPVRKKDKKNKLSNFVEKNIGKVLSTKEMADGAEVSQPTLYKFINENRGHFRKVGRGMYEIVDAKKVREVEKK